MAAAMSTVTRAYMPLLQNHVVGIRIKNQLAQLSYRSLARGESVRSVFRQDDQTLGVMCFVSGRLSGAVAIVTNVFEYCDTEFGDFHVCRSDKSLRVWIDLQQLTCAKSSVPQEGDGRPDRHRWQKSLAENRGILGRHHTFDSNGGVGRLSLEILDGLLS